MPRPATSGRVPAPRRRRALHHGEAIARIRGAFESLADQLVVLDRRGVIVAENPAWQAFAVDNGIRAGERAPRTGVGTSYIAVCDDARGPDSAEAPEAGAGIAAVLAGRRPAFTLEYPCHSPRQQRWFRMNVTPLRGGGGAVVVHTDITQRRRAEDALAGSEKRFRRLFQEAPLPLALIGRGEVVDDLNARFIQTFGYTRADVPTMAHWRERAFPDPQDRAAADAAWRAAMADAASRGTEIAPGEYRITCADGAVRTMEISGILIQDGFLATFFDVTARIAAEEALRASKADAEAARARAETASASLHELSQAVEQSPDSIVITNLDADIEYVNTAFQRATGYAREEVLGRNSRLLQSGRTPRATYRGLWHALTHGRTWKGEFFNRRKDGVEFVEFAIISPLRHPDGHVTHYVAVKEDITEKKRKDLELDRHRHRLQELVDERTQQLRQVNAELLVSRDRAETANRAKSAFLANMSHEIRTPMNAILGLTHLLARDAVDPVAAARLGRIGEAGNHLLQVINDILDLSKIEAGKFELADADFSLQDLLLHSRALLAERARAKGLEIAIEVSGVPDGLRGDAARLSQALVNLLGNAVKFTATGRIVLRAECSERFEGGLCVRFSVVDTGIGIPADERDHLFTAFAQGDASTTRRFGGTGLGLAITQRLAAMMSGEVGLRSEPGVGSTFWFSARLARSSASAKAPPPADWSDAGAALRQHFGGARLLLAEDNPVNQEVAVELLQSVGLDVVLVDNGAAAVERARRQDFDMILMDVQMPQMDGLEATRQIRALPNHAATPILAMTANAFGEDRRACLAAGMSDHIAKPVDPARLYAALLRGLETRGGGHPPRAAVAAEGPPPAAPAAIVPAIPGVDAAIAIRRLQGRTEAYARVLRQFVQHYADGLPTLRSRIAQDRLATLAETAHSIKGAAAAIGAAGLAAQAEALESAVAAGQPEGAIRSAGQAMIQALAVQVEAIRSALSVDPGPATSRPTERPADEALDELDAMMAAADFAALAGLRQLAPALHGHFGAAAAAVEAALQRFDFEEARVALRALRARAGPPGG